MILNMKNNIRLFLFVIMTLFLLSSCAGGAFHLRQSTRLSGVYVKIALEGISKESALYTTLEQALIEAKGEVVTLSEADSILSIDQLKEDKKIVAYTSARIAREYMIYLNFDYEIKVVGKKPQKRSIRLNKTLIYDSTFVLGKAEEEHRIQQSLREEAARLILLHLQYIGAH